MDQVKILDEENKLFISFFNCYGYIYLLEYYMYITINQQNSTS